MMYRHKQSGRLVEAVQYNGFNEQQVRKLVPDIDLTDLGRCMIVSSSEVYSVQQFYAQFVLQ